MRIRQRAKQSNVELPLILSDHCDWDELTATIAELDPAEVWVTHGREEALVRWCALRGIAGAAAATWSATRTRRSDRAGCSLGAGAGEAVGAGRRGEIRHVEWLVGQGQRLAGPQPLRRFGRRARLGFGRGTVVPSDGFR